RLPLSAQARDGEAHADAVIAVRVEFGTVQRQTSADTHAVFELLDLGAHAAQVLGGDRDAVGFLHAQLARIADLDTLRRIRSDRGQQRQFIDQTSGEGAADLAAAQCASQDLDRPYQLRLVLLKIQYADLRTEARQHVEYGRAGGVHADTFQH